MFHLEVLWRGTADYGVRIGIAAVVALIMLIGGRIVPSFTRNWLVRQSPGRLPQPFGRFDALALAGSVLALVAWIALPQHIVTGVLLLAAGGSPAGPVTALLPIVSSSCCTLLMRLCRWDSCCSARQSCGLRIGRRVPRCMPGRPAHSG